METGEWTTLTSFLGFIGQTLPLIGLVVILPGRAAGPVEVGEGGRHHGSHHAPLVRFLLTGVARPEVPVMRQSEDVTELVGQDEGAGQALVSVEAAAPVLVTDPGDRSVATGTSNIEPRQPDGHVVLLLLRLQAGQEIPVPLVDVLQGHSGVVLQDLIDRLILVENHS